MMRFCLLSVPPCLLLLPPPPQPVRVIIRLAVGRSSTAAAPRFVVAA